MGQLFRFGFALALGVAFLSDAGADVTAIVDGGRYLWIGTSGMGRWEPLGLIRLDKSTGDMVHYNEKNSGLPGHNIGALAIDPQGNLWIACEGLVKFDGENWTVYNEHNSGLPDDNISSIAVDLQGNIWVGTLDQGLAKFDGENWEVYNPENSELPSYEVRCLAVGSSGDIWIGTYCGLARFDGEDWTVYNPEELGVPCNKDIWSITVDKKGDIWFGTGTIRGGLVRFDGENWTVYSVKNSGMPSNIVKALVTDSLGNVWIGTWKGGLVKFDGESWTVYDTENSGLPDNYIWSLEADSQGNIWIGTEENLAVWRDGRIEVVNLYKVEEMKKEVNLPEDLKPLEGIAYWQPPQGRWSYYDIGSQLVVKPWGGGYAVNIEQIWVFGDDLWMTTYDEGTVRMDLRDGSYEIYPGVRGHRIVMDNRGHIWTGGLRGLQEYDGVRWIDHQGPPIPSGWQVGTSYMTPVADSRGNIWFVGQMDSAFWVDSNLSGVSRCGLWRYDVEEGLWSEYPLDFLKSLESFKGFYVDSEGNVWIAMPEEVLEEGRWKVKTRVMRGTPEGDRIVWTEWKLGDYNYKEERFWFQELYGKLWLSAKPLGDTSGQEVFLGTFVFDGEGWTKVADEPIGRLIWDSQGNVWTSGEGAWAFWTNMAPKVKDTVAMFDGESWYYCNNSNPPEELMEVRDKLFRVPDPWGNYIAVDSSGVWIACYGGIIVRWEPLSRPFVEERDEVPYDFALYPAYPNPFNSSAGIPFSLGVSSDVRIAVYDVLGRGVRVLFEGRKEPGVYRVLWDGRDEGGSELASGVYLVRMDAGGFRRVRKVVLVK